MQRLAGADAAAQGAALRAGHPVRCAAPATLPALGRVGPSLGACTLRRQLAVIGGAAQWKLPWAAAARSPGCCTPAPHPPRAAALKSPALHPCSRALPRAGRLRGLCLHRRLRLHRGTAGHQCVAGAGCGVWCCCAAAAVMGWWRQEPSALAACWEATGSLLPAHHRTPPLPHPAGSSAAYHVVWAYGSLCMAVFLVGGRAGGRGGAGLWGLPGCRCWDWRSVRPHQRADVHAAWRAPAPAPNGPLPPSPHVPHRRCAP